MSSLDHVVRDWLIQHKWHPIDEWDRAVAWQRESSDDQWVVYKNMDKVPHALEMFTLNMSDIYNRSQKELMNYFLHYNQDIINIRTIACAGSSNNLIPIGAADSLLGATTNMLQEVAPTALKNVKEIVRVGHTIPGSYIFPITIIIPSGDDNEIFHYPNERVMTENFAKILTLIQNKILTPNTVPTREELKILSREGLKKKFISSICTMLDFKSFKEIDTCFDWAHSLSSPQNISNNIRIPVTARELLLEVADKLDKVTLISETIRGPIVEINKKIDKKDINKIDKKDINFSVYGYREETKRNCHIKTSTDMPLEVITDWMKNGDIITLHGSIENQGNVLYMNNAIITPNEKRHH